MKRFIPTLILSLISAVALAQAPVQKQQSSTPAPVKAVSSVGTLAGNAGGGAASASYAATGKAVLTGNTDSSSTTDAAAARRRVEVLKSNKQTQGATFGEKVNAGSAKSTNPLYEDNGTATVNPLSESAAKSISEKGVSSTKSRKN